MKTNYYLTKTEQKIWEIIKNNETIETTSLKNILPKIEINKVLSNLSKKGKIKRIKKEFYAIPENIKDYHKLALSIHPGYLGLTSALRYYGLLDYEDFIIYIITYNRSKKIGFGKYTFKYISLKEKSIGFKRGGDITISTLEKTFFDCFYMSHFVGYNIITKAIYDAKEIDWNDFICYFKKFASSPLCQKTGYILEMLKNETKTKIPNFVLDYFKSRVKEKTKLINKNIPSKFNKKWLIQDNLGKNRILSWWF